LVSTVQNTSGQARKFPFLPPHGKELEANEQINIVGDLTEAVMRGDRFGNRHINGLLGALDSGDLTIISTPAPIAYDETNSVSKIIGIDNNLLDLSDPCWETSLSEV